MQRWKTVTIIAFLYTAYCTLMLGRFFARGVAAAFSCSVCSLDPLRGARLAVLRSDDPPTVGSSAGSVCRDFQPAYLGDGAALGVRWA